MRAERDQENTAYRCLKLCAGIEDGIEGATFAMDQRWRDMNALVPERRAEEDSEDERTAAAEN